jgi:hypothetical protein
MSRLRRLDRMVSCVLICGFRPLRKWNHSSCMFATGPKPKQISPRSIFASIPFLIEEAFHLGNTAHGIPVVAKLGNGVASRACYIVYDWLDRFGGLGRQRVFSDRKACHERAVGSPSSRLRRTAACNTLSRGRASAYGAFLENGFQRILGGRAEFPARAPGSGVETSKDLPSETTGLLAGT